MNVLKIVVQERLSAEDKTNINMYTYVSWPARRRRSI